MSKEDVLDCGKCEGNGRLWADGKAHYHSDTRPTIDCPACGGSGKDLTGTVESLRTKLAAKDAEIAGLSAENKRLWGIK